jgi:sugar phosphate isomerase/epimerase
MQFAVSTTAFRGQSIREMIRVAKEEGFRLEFSSGLPHDPEIESIFREADCPRMPHNYFPAPRESFVLNLASFHDQTRERSIEHCKKALRLAAAAGAPFYSVHAGLCVDPAPADLGHKLPRQDERPREGYWRRFVESVALLAVEAGVLGVKFLVENNVVSRMNVSSSGRHPLLCASGDEMLRLITEVGNPSLGILLDTGHLKVTSRSLRFSPGTFLADVEEHIRGIHHSDNDGTEDTNRPVTADYWFLRHMQRHADAYHILEVHDQSVSQIREQFRILEQAAHERD